MQRPWPLFHGPLEDESCDIYREAGKESDLLGRPWPGRVPYPGVFLVVDVIHDR
jgi:hypothetical protein